MKVKLKASWLVVVITLLYGIVEYLSTREVAYLVVSVVLGFFVVFLKAWLVRYEEAL